MKALTFPALLGALALLVASCDKPKVAALPPPPGSDGKFADGGATGLVAKMRTLAEAVQNAQKAGDPSKNEQFLAQAVTLLTEARSYVAGVNSAEMPQFVAKLNEYIKPISDLTTTLAPGTAARFTSELNNTNQMFAAMTPASASYSSLSGTELQKLAQAPASSSIPPEMTNAGSPKGRAEYNSSQKPPNPVGQTTQSKSTPPPVSPSPAPAVPTVPAVPATE